MDLSVHFDSDLNLTFHFDSDIDPTFYFDPDPPFLVLILIRIRNPFFILIRNRTGDPDRNLAQRYGFSDPDPRHCYQDCSNYHYTDYLF